MNAQILSWKGFGAVALFVAALLSGCGSSGDADPAGILPDSITISDLKGTDSGSVGQTFSMEVDVVVTGDIPAEQITYTWEQTAGFPVTATTQTNGAYHSTFSFVPVAAGTVTIRVTATTQSGKTSSQAKTVTVNP